MKKYVEAMTKMHRAYIPRTAEIDVDSFLEAVELHNKFMLTYGFLQQDPDFIAFRANIALYVPNK